MSIFSAAGCFGSPGIFRIFPVITTMNPAPLEIEMSFTCILKFEGRPNKAGLSEIEYCVFAMQTGR